MEMEMVKEQVVTATNFKAKCLSLLDDVEVRGETIMITRWGKPVAKLSSAGRDAWKSPRNSWAGKAEIIGDIVNTDTSGRWEVSQKD